MEIQKEDYTILHFDGDLEDKKDFETLYQLCESLLRKGTGAIAVRLDGNRHDSRTVTGALVILGQLACKQGAKLALICAADTLREDLTYVCNLLQIRLCPSADEL